MRRRLSGELCRGPEAGGRPRSARRAVAILALLALWAPAWAALAAQGPEPARDAPVDRAQEDTRLQAAFRYLGVSTAQRGQLLWAARQIEGRRSVFADEERRIQAEVERLAGRDPESAARLTQMLERDRAQTAVDILVFAAPHLVRTLTRTQILLAWRLEQGRPPKAYPADPILLDPAAGFVVSAPGITTFLAPVQRIDLGAPGGTPEGQARVERALLEEQMARAEQARADAEVARAEQARDAADLARAQQARALAEYERTLVMAQEQLRSVQGQTYDLGGVTLSLAANPLSNPHFPQRVVESDSVEELAAAIEPFARRLFMSPRLAAVLARGGWARASATAPARPSGAPRLARDYRLGHDFHDVSSRGPDLLPLGGGIQQGLYRFGAGQGLMLPDAGMTDHYAVELIFGCTAMEGYQKLIDFKDRTVDEGLYLYNNRLTFYNLAEGGSASPDVMHRLRLEPSLLPAVRTDDPAASPGVMHRLRLERDRSTRIVRAYLDRQYAFAFLDLDDDAAFKEARGLLFVDDKTTTGEQGPGVVASLQIWDRPEGR